MKAQTAGFLALLLAVSAAACGDPAAVDPATALLEISPEGGAMDVAPDARVVASFDGPLATDAPEHATVFEGGTAGAVVEGAWTLAGDATRLRFTPAVALDGETGYTVYLSDQLQDAHGAPVDLETHGLDMGGMRAPDGVVFMYTTDVVETSTFLIDIQPRGGATDVDPAAPVVVTFDNAVDPRGTDYMSLHEGDVHGEVLDGSWSFSADSSRLTFSPAPTLKPARTYTIHVGGGLRDADGNYVDVETHGKELGGVVATRLRLDPTGGEHQDHDHPVHAEQGEWWDHPTKEDTHGMLFEFTTAR